MRKDALPLLVGSSFIVASLLAVPGRSGAG